MEDVYKTIEQIAVGVDSKTLIVLANKIIPYFYFKTVMTSITIVVSLSLVIFAVWYMTKELYDN